MLADCSYFLGYIRSDGFSPRHLDVKMWGEVGRLGISFLFRSIFFSPSRKVRKGINSSFLYSEDHLRPHLFFFCHWLIVHSKLSKLGVTEVGMFLDRTEVRSISPSEIRVHIPIGGASLQITSRQSDIWTFTFVLDWSLVEKDRGCCLITLMEIP